MIDRKKFLEEYGLNVDVLFDRIDQLESALDRLSRLGNGSNVGNSIGNEIAYRCLKNKTIIDLKEDI